MNIETLLPKFIEHLRDERQLEPETIANYTSDLNQLNSFVAGKPVNEISIDDLRGFMRDLKNKGRARATIRRKVHTASSFWRFLHIIGKVDDHMPDKVLKLLPKYRRTVPDKFLSVSELKRFSGTPAPLLRDTLAWKILAWLGLRRSELLNLKIENVRLSENEIIITGKGNHQRIMPLNEELNLLIKAVAWGRQNNEYLLESVLGGHWGKDSFSKAFRDHLIRCELEGKGYTPHTLRHTFATHLAMAGTPIAKISRLMGHQDFSTTWKYIHHSPEHLKEGMLLHPLNEENTP